MKIVIEKDYESMSKAVANHIIEMIKKKPNALIELPGGDTPLGIFKELVNASKTKNVDFSKCFFVSLDEWENLGYETKGSCKQTLFDCLYKQLPIDLERQVCFFDGKADLEKECQRVDQFIFDHGNLDLAVLGIGMNGHVGFNEPGFDENQYCTVVPLDAVTQSVSVKYFGEQLNVAHGITLGFKHFLNAKEVILIADSERKADIVQKVIEGPLTNEVPASLIRKVKHSTIYLDRQASKKLKHQSLEAGY